MLFVQTLERIKPNLVWNPCKQDLEGKVKIWVETGTFYGKDEFLTL